MLPILSQSKKPWLALLFLGIGVTLVALFAFLNGGKIVLQLPRSELQLCQGHLVQKGHTNPFTGIMVEFYGNNVLQSRSEVVNGLLNGISEGWHTNRQLAVREHFVNGVSSGLRVKRHLNGRNESEVNIVQGKLHGTFRKWSDSGALLEKIQMKQGIPDGLSRAYYKSGFLKSETSFQDGKLVSQSFWKDGEKPAGSAR